MDLAEFKSLQHRVQGQEPTNKLSRSWAIYSAMFGEQWYQIHTVPKSSGGRRRIEAPTTQLKEVQRNLLQKAEMFDVSQVAYGLGERDYVENAKHHQGNQFILRIDLKEFYRSTSLQRALEVMPAGPEKDFIKNNALYIFYTHDEGSHGMQYQTFLATGSPLSPIVANLVVKKMDDDIIKIAEKYSVKYTRYLDDMVFSSNDISEEDRFSLFKEVVERIVEDGWRINKRKSKWLDPNKDAMVITGVDVRSQPKITRRYITNEIKPLMNNLAKEICMWGPSQCRDGAQFSPRLPWYGHWTNIETIDDLVKRIPAQHSGQIGYVRQVSPEQYNKLLQHLCKRIAKQNSYQDVLGPEVRIRSWAEEYLISKVDPQQFPAGAPTTKEIDDLASAIQNEYDRIMQETELPAPVALIKAAVARMYNGSS